MEIITLAHGSGGKLTQELIEDHFLPRFKSKTLSELLDSALIYPPACKLAFTTDAFVVKPPFFPGGNIGKLAVCGSVNDLTCVGAKPLFMSLSFILEEGLKLSDLDIILDSIGQNAEELGIEIVCGDTKVVEAGSADKIFISTSAIGLRQMAEDPAPSSIIPGDKILLTGPIGDHGMAVLQARENFFQSLDLISDCAGLWPVISSLIEQGIKIHAMRDPTRGGLATILAELARSSGFCVEVKDNLIPVRETVGAACQMLGIDPLFLACEGRMVIVVAKEDEEKALGILRKNPLSSEATCIGACLSEPKERALLLTEIGGKRILEPLTGEQLPRIC